METVPQVENQEHFPYEIKISVYTSTKELEAKIESGEPINFTVTKDFSIWLTTGPHNSLSDHGITWKDIDCLGFVKITENKPEIKFYGDRPKKSPQIRESIFNFLDLI